MVFFNNTLKCEHNMGRICYDYAQIRIPTFSFVVNGGTYKEVILYYWISVIVDIINKLLLTYNIIYIFAGSICKYILC